MRSIALQAPLLQQDKDEFWYQHTRVQVVGQSSRVPAFTSVRDYSLREPLHALENRGYIKP
jgi:hypothetical protein